MSVIFVNVCIKTYEKCDNDMQIILYELSPFSFPPFCLSGMEGEASGESGEMKSSLPFAPMPHQSLGAALGITGATGPNANIAPYQRGPPEEYLARIALQVGDSRFMVFLAFFPYSTFLRMSNPVHTNSL